MLATAATFLGAVIDFFEEIVVLPDQHVLGIQLDRGVVRLARVVELARMLVSDREIVPGFRVRRIEFDCALPPVLRLTPQPVLRDLDAEIDLFLRPRAFARGWATL